MVAPPPPDLAIDRRATVRRIDLDAGSWVDVVDGFVRDPRGALDSLLADTAWGQQEVLRYDQYVPEQRLSAGLRADSSPLVRHTDLHLQATYRVPFDGVAALLYRDGTDFQGLHSDRGMKWLDDTRIAIVVLGQRRPFVIRRRGDWIESLASRVPAGKDPDDLVLLPGEGDLLVMGGACQRDWLHGIPAADTPNPRVSLTWRWTSKRGRPDTNPGYSDGRQFSGSPSRPGVRPRRSA
ncbi:MAG: DNA repair protein [Actinobacteria bacterium]|nr:DNA repair protein [Actinomycetota bacterium]